jgi:hypothetical protein
MISIFLEQYHVSAAGGDIFSEDYMFNDTYLRMAAFSTCQLFGVRSIFEIAPYG